MNDKLLYQGLQIVRQRYLYEDQIREQQQRQRNQLQFYSQVQHPNALASFKQNPQAMMQLPLPFGLMLYPNESFIQLGFDYSSNRNQQMRIDQLVNREYYKQNPKKKVTNGFIKLPSINSQKIMQEQQREIQHLKKKIIQQEKKEQQLMQELTISHRGRKSQQKKKGISQKKRKFRIFCARMIFISYLIKALKQEIQRILEEQNNICSKRDIILDQLIEIYQDNLEESIILLLNTQQDLKFIDGQDDTNNVKCNIITNIIMNLLNDITTVQPNLLMDSFYQFLIITCSNKGFPPYDYLLEFEVLRLRISSIGSIKSINIQQQLMIIWSTIIIKIIIFGIIIRSQTYYPQQMDNSLLFIIERNSIIIASILQWMFVNQFENEQKYKFDWKKKRLNTISRVVQLADNEIDLQQRQTLIKDLLPFSETNQYIQLMQKDKEQYQQIIQQQYQYMVDIQQQLQLFISKQPKENRRMIDIILQYIDQE